MPRRLVFGSFLRSGMRESDYRSGFERTGQVEFSLSIETKNVSLMCCLRDRDRARRAGNLRALTYSLPFSSSM